jgi:Xaa-Pro aminopeptidase
VIDTAVLQAGGRTNHTIVAGGRQTCDPHEPGHGPLRANEPIILDVFPRSQKTGYFGDLTRTVVRGRASEAVRRLYDTVARAQEVAIALLLPNAKAVQVHDSVQTFFDKEGFKTVKKGSRMQGFFHGSGHGVGLEIQEAPILGVASPDVLAAGQVVTVEPGLYYPGLGGVRLEDVVTVTAQGARNLTKFEKVLEL